MSLMRSFWSATGRLLRSTRAVAAPLARGVQILKSLDLAERVDGRLEHVVRIVGAEGLGEDVLHPRRLQHRTDGAARDDARPWDGRLEEDAARAEVSGDLTGNRRLPERYEDQVLLRVLDRFADGLRHLVGLAETHADVTAAVAHDHERGEREPPSALDDLGHPVDGHHPVVKGGRRFSFTALVV